MSMRTVCRSCGEPIIWTITERGARMPLDALPVDDGTVLVIGHAFGESLGLSRVLSGDALTTAHEAGAPLHRSHFATCPQASGWRRSRQRKERHAHADH